MLRWSRIKRLLKIVESYALEVASQVADRSRKRRIVGIPFNIHLLDDEEGWSCAVKFMWWSFNLYSILHILNPQSADTAIAVVNCQWALMVLYLLFVDSQLAYSQNRLFLQVRIWICCYFVHTNFLLAPYFPSFYLILLNIFHLLHILFLLPLFEVVASYFL